jgi:preprotein translocase subunit YajC
MVTMVAMMNMMMTMIYFIIIHTITYYIIICLRRACMKAESDSMAHFTSSSALVPS